MHNTCGDICIYRYALISWGLTYMKTSPNFARRKMIESQNKSKQHYNMSCRKLQPLKVGVH